MKRYPRIALDPNAPCYAREKPRRAPAPDFITVVRQAKAALEAEMETVEYRMKLLNDIIAIYET